MKTLVPRSTPVGDSPVIRLDFGYLYHLLLSKAWLIILLVVLSLSAAIIYLIRTPKIYESRAVIQVDQEAQKFVNTQNNSSPNEEFKSVEELTTIAQTLMSDTVLLRVIKANELDKDPLFAPPKKDGSAYLDSELVGRFMRKVTVGLRRGTRLIDVSVQDTDPKRAQKLAQSMVTEFISQIFDQKFSVSKAANDFLIQEADRLKEKLHKSEQALQQYREDHHAVSLEDKQNIIVEKLKELNLKVTQAKSERLKLEADVAIIKQGKANTPEKLLMLPSVAALPVVSELRRELADKESRYKAESQLSGLQESLNRTLVNVGNMVIKSYEAAKSTEAMLTTALQEQEQAALELNKIAIPYNVLEREVESDRALYESVLTGMKQTNLNQGLGQKFNIRVIEAPLVSASPVKPRKLMILALAILGGFVAGNALVIGIAMADSSIRNVNQVEEVLGLPVLTLVPRSKRRHIDKEPVLTARPGSHEAEAFRSLRTALSFLGNQKDSKAVLFTSANPGEGKTYCSLNCGAALAQLGLRTLLIDADLRRPNLTKALLAGSRGPGLSACLTGNATFMDCCRPTSTENLFILGAGERVSNPAELLASGDLVGLLKEAMLYFDRVVIDSAPVNAVSDTQLIAKEIESVCLVIRAGKTPRRAIVRACGLLERATHNPDAVVLNRVERRSRDDYYFARYASMYVKAQAYRSESTVDQY
ncbi:MAG TPA: polysaccharide biosynthesis tyrosine autokinase [Chthoniobacterales bacterium]|nr:polysaccharide biosynthesis tyrosine autokinase [Chthoniobacterales bacterium]